MKSGNNDIANELRDIIPEAEWPGLTPPVGEVPPRYFEQLPLQIMQKIRSEEIQNELINISPLLADIPKTFPLSAPADYFEQLPEQIRHKITVQEELENISPLLAGLSKEVPFSVPAGYFGQLSANVHSAIKPAAKVIPMRSRLKWAVAAGLIAIISAGTLFFMRQNQPAQTVVSENTLAGVSDQAIVDYLQTHMDAFDKEELLSLASLNIETASTVPLPETGEMSAEAIRKYLENTGLLKENPTEN